MNEGSQTFSRKLKDFSVSLRLSGEQLNIQLRNSTATYMLSALLQNGKLPSNFTNILDSVQQIYEYIRNDRNSMISLSDNSQMLQISVPSPLVKTKILQVPLIQVPISKEELIEMDLKRQKAQIKKLQEKVAKLQKIIVDVVPNQMQKLVDTQLNLFKKQIESDFEKYKYNQNSSAQSASTKKTATSPSSTTNNIFKNPAGNNIFSTKPSTVPSSPTGNSFTAPYSYNPKTQPQTQPKSYLNSFVSFGQNKSTAIPLIDWRDSFKQKNGTVSHNQSLDVEFKNDVANQENKQTKQIVTKAKIFDFDIDQSNKYLSYYTVKGNKITKKYDNGDEVYQVYSSNPIPEEGRHQVIFQIDQITDNMIWVGLITHSKKKQSFIGDEPQTISLGCNGGKDLSVDGRKLDLIVQQIGKGHLLTMQIQIKAKKVKFFKNYNSTPFAVIELPESMIGKAIYPFLQMVAQKDSVTLIN